MADRSDSESYMEHIQQRLNHQTVEMWRERALAAELEKELGDLDAAIGFVVDHNEDRLSPLLIHGRSEHKRLLFEDWHGRSTSFAQVKEDK
jgi:hypothetical protein